MNCPYCGCSTEDAAHFKTCDMNPEVQRRMMDLLGLSFKVGSLYVRITEVMPGEQKPIRANILTYKNINDELTASVQSAKLHYSSVCNQIFDDAGEYDRIARRLIEDIGRTIHD